MFFLVASCLSLIIKNSDLLKRLSLVFLCLHQEVVLDRWGQHQHGQHRWHQPQHPLHQSERPYWLEPFNVPLCVSIVRQLSLVTGQMFTLKRLYPCF